MCKPPSFSASDKTRSKAAFSGGEPLIASIIDSRSSFAHHRSPMMQPSSRLRQSAFLRVWVSLESANERFNQASITSSIRSCAVSGRSCSSGQPSGLQFHSTFAKSASLGGIILNAIERVKDSSSPTLARSASSMTTRVSPDVK